MDDYLRFFRLHYHPHLLPDRSSDLRTLLQDRHLQDLVRSIDSSTDPMTSLENYLSNPQLEGLIDCIRSTIDNKFTKIE
jgi:hypothetical protein